MDPQFINYIRGMIQLSHNKYPTYRLWNLYFGMLLTDKTHQHSTQCNCPGCYYRDDHPQSFKKLFGCVYRNDDSSIVLPNISIVKVKIETFCEIFECKVDYDICL